MTKIFECHVFYVLFNIISVDNVVCNNQFGFRAGFSTECTLLAMTQHWLNTLEFDKSICALFFDVSNTFYFVPHDPLLHTPCNLGLPAQLLCWFRSYLSDCFQQVSLSCGFPPKLLFLLVFHRVPSLAAYCVFYMYMLVTFLNFPFHLIPALLCMLMIFFFPAKICSTQCLQKVQRDIDLISSCLSQVPYN